MIAPKSKSADNREVSPVIGAHLDFARLWLESHAQPNCSAQLYSTVTQGCNSFLEPETLIRPQISIDSKPPGVYSPACMIPISHILFPHAPTGPHTGLCALCGHEGPGQYERDILDITTSNVTALFELAYDLICAPCYSVWTRPKYWHRGIFATTAGVQFPVISRESATFERPVWSDIFRGMHAGQTRGIVLTTDPKKRVWPFARVSTGDTAWVYIHDPSRGVSGNRAVSIKKLVAALNLIEEVYSLGWSKPWIATSLIGCRTVARAGLDAAIALDQRLAAIRNEPEFLPALIVAQKKEDSA